MIQIPSMANTPLSASSKTYFAGESSIAGHTHCTPACAKANEVLETRATG